MNEKENIQEIFNNLNEQNQNTMILIAQSMSVAQANKN